MKQRWWQLSAHPLYQRLSAILLHSPLLRWYQGQVPQDRRILLLLLIFLVLVTGWLGVWSPVQSQLSQAHNRHRAALEDHHWLRHNVPVIKHRAKSPDARSGRSILGQVANSARESGLVLNRFNPSDAGGLTVSLDDVAFSELIFWLERLSVRHGIHVNQANISSTGQGDRVRARLVLY